MSNTKDNALLVTLAEMEHWLCHSTPLLSPDNTNCPLVSQSTLMGLWKQAEESAPNEDSLLPRRLGYAAEAIFKNLITRSSWQLIAQQHVVYQDKITLGELDFVVQRDPSSDVQEHWELATKFYLFDPKSRHFIGPNAKDRLEDKCQRMASHQLAMGKHPITRADFPLIHHSALIIKGYLYMPYSNTAEHRQTSPPEHGLSFKLNPNFSRGWWLTESQSLVEQQNWSQDGLTWLVLQKLEWMSEGINIQALPKSRELDRVPTDTRLPYQIVLLRHDSGHWHETSRGFVVSDPWPKPTA